MGKRDTTLERGEMGIIKQFLSSEWALVTLAWLLVGVTIVAGYGRWPW